MGTDRIAVPEAVPDGVVFEAERFEWSADGRLEVAGRWYGLRGHRFVRPALTVDAGNGRRRVLADLDHKPWAAEDGEEWIAAFPWDGDPAQVAGAELAVAPTLTVDLPPPRTRGRRSAKAAARPVSGPMPVRRSAPEPVAPRHAPTPTRHEPPARTPAPSAPGRREAPPLAAAPAPAPASTDAELGSLRDEVADLRAQLAAQRAAAKRLEAELSDARERLAADARRNAQDRETIVAERDAAARDRAAAVRERDEARDALATAVRERDDAIAQRDRAIRERDDARRRAAEAERHLEAYDRTMPPAAPTLRRPVPPPPHARPRSAAAVWAQRFVALVVLVAIALVVYALVRGAL